MVLAVSFRSARHKGRPASAVLSKRPKLIHASDTQGALCLNSPVRRMHPGTRLSGPRECKQTLQDLLSGTTYCAKELRGSASVEVGTNMLWHTFRAKALNQGLGLKDNQFLMIVHKTKARSSDTATAMECAVLHDSEQLKED